MDKNIIVFLIKLFGTFAFLIFVIILGKELKSSKALNENISYGSPHLKNIVTVNKTHQKIELQIQLEEIDARMSC
ncbi:hypothetical protein [Nitrosomonas sp. Nm166]|uniref:hypothetical protein n=1 Tax=Nitrosomonas sp. Nm166 TaxID=1881054 RepID=UPI0008E2A0BE|nr:hypothetical protein [Nitrosomonas sp. Nm166]SFE40595.1 hypothetical protein SAMN05428977_101535 [Nitrosomonas sp. Nm166]